MLKIFLLVITILSITMCNENDDNVLYIDRLYTKYNLNDMYGNICSNVELCENILKIIKGYRNVEEYTEIVYTNIIGDNLIFYEVIYDNIEYIFTFSIYKIKDKSFLTIHYMRENIYD